jgi:polyribonucleotide nucleotidyltransferase
VVVGANDSMVLVAVACSAAQPSITFVPQIAAVKVEV